MGLTIVFYFANGDEHDVHMCYSSYWDRIVPLFTEEERDKWHMCCGDEIIEGEYVVRTWEVCRQAGYINPQDDRVPVKMLHC